MLSWEFDDEQAVDGVGVSRHHADDALAAALLRLVGEAGMRLMYALRVIVTTTCSSGIRSSSLNSPPSSSTILVRRASP